MSIQAREIKGVADERIQRGSNRKQPLGLYGHGLTPTNGVVNSKSAKAQWSPIGRMDHAPKSEFEDKMRRAFYFIHEMERRGCQPWIDGHRVYLAGGYASLDELDQMREIRPFLRYAISLGVGHA